MRRPSSPSPRPSLAGDGIYRAILWVMVVTVIGGAILAIAGETLAQDPALARLGTGMALLGGAIYGFFRWLGIRETRRRQIPAETRETIPPETNSRP
jgi:hypothetical protein